MNASVQNNQILYSFVTRAMSGPRCIEERQKMETGLVPLLMQVQAVIASLMVQQNELLSIRLPCEQIHVETIRRQRCIEAEGTLLLEHPVEGSWHSWSLVPHG